MDTISECRIMDGIHDGYRYASSVLPTVLLSALASHWLYRIKIRQHNGVYRAVCGCGDDDCGRGNTRTTWVWKQEVLETLRDLVCSVCGVPNRNDDTRGFKFRQAIPPTNNPLCHCIMPVSRDCFAAYAGSCRSGENNRKEQKPLLKAKST